MVNHRTFFEYIPLNKRGISELIVTVLLIGFTVGLAAVIITWGSQFVQESVETAESEGSVRVASGGFDIRLKSAGIDVGKLLVTVENTGTVPVEELFIRANANLIKADLSSTLQGELAPFDIKTYNFSNFVLPQGTILEVIPGADLDRDGTVDFLAEKRDEVPVEFFSFRVFVTSDSWNGDLGGLAGADTKCQAAANNANLGGTWKAWLSTDTTSASSRLYHSSIPYKLINGQTVSNDWDELTTGFLPPVYLRNPISRTELNAVPPEPYVFTNTLVNGASVGNNDCSDWQSTIGTPLLGFSTDQSGGWTNSGPLNACGNLDNHLYCFEQPA